MQFCRAGFNLPFGHACGEDGGRLKPALQSRMTTGETPIISYAGPALRGRHFWRRWWTRLLVVTVVAGALFAVYRQVTWRYCWVSVKNPTDVMVFLSATEREFVWGEGKLVGLKSARLSVESNGYVSCGDNLRMPDVTPGGGDWQLLIHRYGGVYAHNKERNTMTMCGTLVVVDEATFNGIVAGKPWREAWTQLRSLSPSPNANAVKAWPSYHPEWDTGAP